MGDYEHLRVDGEPLTEPEKYVLEQVEQGEWADLENKFGDQEENRKLRAGFLEALLTSRLSGVEVHRRGVMIGHAVITGDLDLIYAEVPHYVAIADSHFQSWVLFKDAIFRKNLLLDGTIFAKKANFQRVQVGIEVLCRKAIFQGDVDFFGAEISGAFVATGAKFNTVWVGHATTFNGMKVGKSAFFDKAEFQWSVDFGRMDISGEFVVKGAKFKSKQSVANFNGMKIGQDAIFDKAEFQGPVNFEGAYIVGHFNANEAEFRNPEQPANFSGLKVGQDASFDNAEFYGPVDIVCADIGGQFSANGVEFKSTVNTANFNGMKVSGDVFFEEAEFQGPVVLVCVDIGGHFIANGARFESPNYPADFDGMKVIGTAHFQNTHFRGPVKFHMDIGLNLIAHAAEFHSPEHNVDCNFMKIGQSAFFNDVVFAGKVFLSMAQMTDLHLSAPKIEELSLEGSKIARKLKIEHTGRDKSIIIDRLASRNLQVQGLATFKNLQITKEVDLRDANFQQVELIEVTWPNAKDKIWLDGLTYLSITTQEHKNKEEASKEIPAKKDAKESNDWKQLLAWLKQSRFNTQNYSQLEEYAQRCGHRKEANEVYIKGKRRELKNRKWWWPSTLVTWVLWDGLTGYGRKSGRTFWAALGLIFLGTIFFTPPILHKDHWLTQTSFYQAAISDSLRAENGPVAPTTEPAKKGDGPMMAGKVDSRTSQEPGGKVSRNGHWDNLALRGIISIDRLLPSWVDLGFARAWEPKEKEISRWALFYWNFHRVCGWVLVVLGLAALGTRFK